MQIYGYNVNVGFFLPYPPGYSPIERDRYQIAIDVAIVCQIAFIAISLFVDTLIVLSIKCVVLTGIYIGKSCIDAAKKAMNDLKDLHTTVQHLQQEQKQQIEDLREVCNQFRQEVSEKTLNAFIATFQAAGIQLDFPTEFVEAMKGYQQFTIDVQTFFNEGKEALKQIANILTFFYYKMDKRMEQMERKIDINNGNQVQLLEVVRAITPDGLALLPPPQNNTEGAATALPTITETIVEISENTG